MSDHADARDTEGCGRVPSGGGDSGGAKGLDECVGWCVVGGKGGWLALVWNMKGMFVAVNGPAPEEGGGVLVERGIEEGRGGCGGSGREKQVSFILYRLIHKSFSFQPHFSS